MMTALIDTIWALFGSIMLVVAGLYAYFLLRVQHWLDKYKSKDWRYDG